ncbi:hypothetical protein, partial [Endozoicomonas acroporae]|uniref:hypothetical protein n=2 Tax=Endozoicomonas TaxID=305899 RepID=UPI003D7BB575
DFVKQFTRDLVNGDVSSLDQIRWHFEGKALGKRAFSNEDKQRLLAEIEKIEFQDERKVLSKLQVPNLDKAMLFKSIEQNFDGIFKII